MKIAEIREIATNELAERIQTEVDTETRDYYRLYCTSGYHYR